MSSCAIRRIVYVSRLKVDFSSGVAIRGIAYVSINVSVYNVSVYINFILEPFMSSCALCGIAYVFVTHRQQSRRY